MKNFFCCNSQDIHSLSEEKQVSKDLPFRPTVRKNSRCVLFSSDSTPAFSIALVILQGESDKSLTFCPPLF